MVRRQPGVIAIAGPEGIGATRLAHEVAARLASDGHVLLHLDGGLDNALERLGDQLEAQELYRDLERAARIRPIVVLAGDCPPKSPEPRRLAERLAGTRALLIVTASRPPDEVSALSPTPLDDPEVALIAHAVTPSLDPHVDAQIVRLSAGLPGRAVALAQAATDPPGVDEPLSVPDALAAPTLDALTGLSSVARELARWAAVGPETVDPTVVGRLTSRTTSAVESHFDALTAAGILAPLAAPGPPQWSFPDPLAREAIIQAMPAAELRRHAAGALVDGRMRGAPPTELVRYATLARDPSAVVALAPRAAEWLRRSGEPAAALAEAERGLRWHGELCDPRALLHLQRERGLALAELARWDDSVASLDAAAAGYAESGFDDELLQTASAASSALWMLGRHAEALDALTRHLDARDDSRPSAARAEALTQAAGVAAASSRFARARTLAERAREQSQAAGDAESATRALIFLGSAEVGGSGRDEGTAHFTDAIAEARASGSTRNETLALIHQSHALLLLGQPARAEATAREGVARASDLDIEDHRLVLEGNLGDALIARGSLGEARHRLETAAEGWRALGRGTPTPADPGLAWLHFAEGDHGRAAERFAELDRVAETDATLFELASPIGAGHAWAQIALGDRERAQEIVARHLELWSRGDDRLGVVRVAVAGVAAGGDIAPACRDLLADLAGGGSSLAAAFQPFADAHLLAESDPAAAVDRMRRSVDALLGLGNRWWAVFARFLAGSTGADGTADLLTARQEFREMGADAWRLRTEGELRARGRRIPSRTDGRPDHPGDLSARELEVLGQLAEGLTNREIGRELFISERTVARHVGKILSKLSVKNRTSAVREARQRGLLRMERRHPAHDGQ